MQKRIIALLSAAVLVLSMSACGEADTQPDTTVPETSQTNRFAGEGDIAVPTDRGETAAPTGTTATTGSTTQKPSDDASKIGPLFQTMVRERVRTGTYTVRFKQSGMSVVTSVSGKDSAFESNAAGLLQFTLINKGGRYFMTMPTTKKYVELSSEDYKEQANAFGDSSMELDDLTLTQTGTETLGGKKYNTETYDEGSRGTVTYFFDDTGLRKARVVKDGKTSMVDTFEVVTGVDASVFEIPADYVEVSDPGQLLA